MAKSVSVPNLTKDIKFEIGGLLAFRYMKQESPYVYVIVEDPSNLDLCYLMNLKNGRTTGKSNPKSSLDSVKDIESFSKMFGMHSTMIESKYFSLYKYSITIEEE